MYIFKMLGNLLTMITLLTIKTELYKDHPFHHLYM